MVELPQPVDINPQPFSTLSLLANKALLSPLLNRHGCKLPELSTPSPDVPLTAL